MKVSKDFDLREFVPPGIWRRFGENSVWFIRQEVIDLAQFYRDYFGRPVRVNDWHYGGDFSLRGFRPPAAKVGAELSQHKFGNAFDCDIEGFSADAVREEILSNPEPFKDAGLTTLESGRFAPTWVHSDLRTTAQDDILIVGV